MKEEIIYTNWNDFVKHNSAELFYELHDALVDFLTDIFDPEDTEKIAMKFTSRHLESTYITTLDFRIPDADKMYHIDDIGTITLMYSYDPYEHELNFAHGHFTAVCYVAGSSDLIMKNGKLKTIHSVEY